VLRGQRTRWNTKTVITATLLAASLAVPATAHADPGFSPEEAGTIDDHLHRMDAHGRILPLPFIVTDIQPAPNNLAGATLATQGESPRQNSNGRPIVLVDQGGQWLITHDSAMDELDVFWRVANRSLGYVK
jgi:hypothetical protein